MASQQQDFPLIDEAHAPTRHHPYGSEPFTNGSSSDPDPIGSGSEIRSPYYNNNNNNKKRKTESDYRKDREEWSETAIACLLEAYTDKYRQLNKGNLRGKDWEEVAEAVSEKCGAAWKSVEQCKNKIDNLKRRFRVELNRIGNNGISNWHWFNKIEVIIGNLNNNKVVVGGVVGGGGGGGGSSESEERSGSCSQVVRQSSNNVNDSNNLKLKTVLQQQPSLKWQRVVFKISGAALAGNCQSINSKVAMQIAREVATACRVGVEVAIVIGGRNFFCGDTWVSAMGLERPTAYQIGMMATLMNSILLQSALEKQGVPTRVQSAFSLPEVAEPYNRRRAIRHLEKGRVVIFGGVAKGSGNPLFTTDTAAALRASEINANAVLKGTNVNGIYDCHSGNGNGILDHISFREAVSRGDTSMDTMAITCCEENGIPVVVFNMLEPGNISRALCGDQVGTLIDQAGRIS